MPIYRGDNGSDRISGSAIDDIIYGYAGEDILNGRSGDDEIYGGADSDDLIGGTGADVLIGGSGADWFVAGPRGDYWSDDLIVDFEFGLDRVDLSAWGVSDFNQVKEILSSDEFGDATLYTYYNGYAYIFTFEDVRASEFLPKDFVFDDLGAKNETGTAYQDMLFGSREGDVLRGKAGHDSLLGGKGDDRLYGNWGDDQLIGGSGDDVLRGNRGNDDLWGQRGQDELIGGPGDDLLVGGKAADFLSGSKGNDVLRGGTGRDVLEGKSGADQLFGGSGADILFGGLGADELKGGPGKDTFLFTGLKQSEPGSGYRDYILGFQTDLDRIDISEIDARPDMRGDQDFDFIGRSDFSDPGQVRFFHEGQNTIVQVNTNFNDAPEMEISVAGRVNFIADDFLL